ncbi:uncharacterized protein LOC135160290 isoform X1 [Diachasmimorpha longicaudata]|uniref:uncharacterized protein LOC135160290 isoform X1 n=1 Tax=Diachasmimorpha longicaudata TaxID=58733 RepID=UPI0030B8DFCF
MNTTNSPAIGRHNPPIIMPQDISILYNMILSYRARVIIGRSCYALPSSTSYSLSFRALPRSHSSESTDTALLLPVLHLPFPPSCSEFTLLYLAHLSSNISPLTHCTYLLDAYATRVGDQRRGGALDAPHFLSPSHHLLRLPLFGIYQLHRIMRINTRERSLQDQRRRYSIASLQQARTITWIRTSFFKITTAYDISHSPHPPSIIVYKHFPNKFTIQRRRERFRCTYTHVTSISYLQNWCVHNVYVVSNKWQLFQQSISATTRATRITLNLGAAPTKPKPTPFYLYFHLPRMFEGIVDALFRLAVLSALSSHRTTTTNYPKPSQAQSPRFTLCLQRATDKSPSNHCRSVALTFLGHATCCIKLEIKNSHNDSPWHLILMRCQDLMIPPSPSSAPR